MADDTPDEAAQGASSSDDQSRQDTGDAAEGAGDRPARGTTGRRRQTQGAASSRRKTAGSGSRPRSTGRAAAGGTTKKRAAEPDAAKQASSGKTTARKSRAKKPSPAEGGAAAAGAEGGAAATGAKAGGGRKRTTTAKRKPAKKAPAGPSEQTALTLAEAPVTPVEGGAAAKPAAAAAAAEPAATTAAAEPAPPAAKAAAGAAPMAPAVETVTGAPVEGERAAAAGAARRRPRAARARSIVAPVLVVMAVLAVAVGVVAVWTHQLVFDTGTYVRTVAPIYDDAKARHAVSVYVTDKAIDVGDVSSRIEKALPDRIAFLAGPLTEELRQFLIREIDRFLATGTARKLWVNINRFAHEQLITALQDENRYVTVGKNDVKLNLVPLVAVALQKLEARMPDILGKNVQLPQIDPDTPPDDIRLQLQDALGRELPKDFGTITVLRGSQGYEAKRALGLFNDLVILVVIVAVVLVVAALLVSTRRRRTGLQLGLGVLIAFVIAKAIERQATKAVADAVKSENGVAVTRAVMTSVTNSLDRFFVWVAVAAAVVVVIAFLAGRRGWTGSMGRGFSKLFRASSHLSAPDTRAARWAGEHLDLLRTGGVVVAIVALFFAAGSLAAIVTLILVLVVYELALWVYAVGLPEEEDDAKHEPHRT